MVSEEAFTKHQRRVKAALGSLPDYIERDYRLGLIMDRQWSDIKALTEFADVALEMLGDSCDAVTLCRERLEKIQPILDRHGGQN